MRITFVLPEANLSGGVRVVAVYAERLIKRGHAVTVVSVPEPRLSFRDRLWHLRHGMGWPKAQPKSPSHLDAIDVEHKILDSRRSVTDADLHDADVIIATWWETAEWVSRLSPRKGAHVYFMQHDETEFYSDDQAALRDRVLATARLPMRKIAVARWIADRVHQRGVPHPVAVVPNAVDLGMFHAPARGKQARPTIGMIYSHTYFKGCDVMLQAWYRARERVPGLGLVVFSSEIPDQRLPLPGEARLVHRPPQHTIRELYSSCDAWLFGSRSEGFGLPILEAMACRTPVIGTPAGAAPELLPRGGGILLGGAHPGEMADAIVRIASMDQAQWKEMSDRAHATARGYTWDDATLALERELARAADGDVPGKSEPHVARIAAGVGS